MAEEWHASSGYDEKKETNSDEMWDLSENTQKFRAITTSFPAIRENFPQPSTEQIEAAARSRLSFIFSDPLNERIEWLPFVIRIPRVWHIFAFIFTLCAMGSVAFYFMRADFIYATLDVQHSVKYIVLSLLLSVLGFIMTMFLAKKPLFFSSLHVVLCFVSLMWGFGIAGPSVFGLYYLFGLYRGLVIVPLGSLFLFSLFAGMILLIPLVVFYYLMPVWGRRASAVRLMVISMFWSIVLSLCMWLPLYVQDEPLYLFLVAYVFVALVIAGIYAVGVGVLLPVKWYVDLPLVVRVFFSLLMVTISIFFFFYLFGGYDVLILRIIAWVLVVTYVCVAILAFVDLARSHDPLLVFDMEGLGSWVDADVVHVDELSFMTDESVVRTWAQETLSRGVFLAARDYYRALSCLAYMSVDDPKSADLVYTVRITRRKLEIAGIPPRLDSVGKQLSIFPNPFSASL